MHKSTVYQTLKKRIEEPRRFIQVLLGPRQVGKTTLALQLEKSLKVPIHYISADTATLEDLKWLESGWNVGRKKAQEHDQALLIIDEVQKIPHWSEMTKKLWDQDTKQGIHLKVILLGSSPWLMQKGLSESLAGRFEILPVTHWSYLEMREAFGWDLDRYIYFGGYPGPQGFATEVEISRWQNYMHDSLIETTISRDILLMTQINKPALLRRLFALGCQYSGQILSFQKMCGQLQDAGNTTTLSHYLELLSGAGMLAGIEKYANQHLRKKTSSPKFQVYNTALMSAQSGKSFEEAKEDHEFWGRLVESAVGAHLLNGIRGKNMELYYWREGNREVDFVLKKGDKLIAIEVKSSWKKEAMPGLELFAKKFSPQQVLVVGNHGFSLEEFLEWDVETLI